MRRRGVSFRGQRTCLRVLPVVVLVLTSCDGGLPKDSASPDSGDSVEGGGINHGGLDGGDSVARPDGGAAEGGSAGAIGSEGGANSPGNGGINGGVSGSRLRAIGITTGELHSCALLDNHRMKCWGDNGYGQLGYGDARSRGNSLEEMGDALPFVDLGQNRTVTKIAAGRYATCAILDDGSLKCWGWSGLNGHFPSDIGDAPNEMGDNLKPLDFGNRKVIDVAVGDEISCAVTDDSSAWCWGASMDGPQRQTSLPPKAIRMLTASGQSVVALYSDGTVSPSLPASPGTNPLFPAAQTFLTLSGANLAQTCGLADSTTVACSDGLSETPLTLPRAAVALGVQWAGELCVVFADGTVQCPERACDGAYWCDAKGNVAIGGSATAISHAGSRFSCVVLVDGTVKCWDEDSSRTATPWLGASVTHENGSTVWSAVDLGNWP